MRLFLLSVGRTCHDSVSWAIVDNFVHAVVCGLTWLTVEYCLDGRTLAECMPRTLLACAAGSLIDADHFWAAVSLSIKVIDHTKRACCPCRQLILYSIAPRLDLFVRCRRPRICASGRCCTRWSL